MTVPTTLLKQRLSWSHVVPWCYVMTFGIVWCLSLTCDVIRYPTMAHKHSSSQWSVTTYSLSLWRLSLTRYVTRHPIASRYGHSTSYGVPHHPHGIPCSPSVWLVLHQCDLAFLAIPRWHATARWGLLWPVATLALLRHDLSSLILQWCDLASPWHSSLSNNITHHPTTSFAVLWQHACKDHIPYAWLYLVLAIYMTTQV
jgi:hypothetical protein